MRKYYHIPIMLSDSEVDFLQRSIKPCEEHRKSRSAIIRHLINKAKKDKTLLQIEE